MFPNTTLLAENMRYNKANRSEYGCHEKTDCYSPFSRGGMPHHWEATLGKHQNQEAEGEGFHG